MTKRVLLINPRMCSRRSMRLPLSLLALGAALEGRREYELLDGNADADATERALQAVAEDAVELVGVSVMPGPQVEPARRISAAIRALRPEVPIVWGGYFPTLYPQAAVNAPYVDYVARGPGEETLPELLERLPDAGPLPGPLDSAAAPRAMEGVRGLTFKDDGRVRHNPDRHFRSPDDDPPYPYHRLGDVVRYLRLSFMGSRTAVHQAAIGCRYHCELCGVVTLFNGVTRLSGPARLEAAVTTLSDRWGATALQFYDNNFFDREETSVPLLEVLARHAMPWSRREPASERTRELGLRQRIRDFATVLGCRFPTVQDHTTPGWGKALLKSLASWRYASGVYGHPWELALARRLIPLREPQSESL